MYKKITKSCTVCTECLSKCVADAIEIKENEQGFEQAYINKEKCIGCNKCINECTQNINSYELKNEKIQFFGAINKDKDILVQSSSGGVFYELAKEFIADGGYVCGCIIDNMVVKHIISNNLNDVKKMMGSKYVRSDTTLVFKSIESVLNDSTKVLFSGTPCQVHAVKNYFKHDKNKNNIYTIDLICHGVTSPKLYNIYIKDLEKKEKKKIVNMKFRSKEKNKDNQNPFRLEIEFENGKKIIKSNLDSWYYYLFLRGDLYQSSCYECKYANCNRYADITLGDYWGGYKIHNIDKQNGFSLVMTNTSAGRFIFDKVKDKFELYKTNIDNARACNKQLSEPSKYSKNRDQLLKFVKQSNLKKIKYIHFKQTFFPKIKAKFIHKI